MSSVILRYMSQSDPCQSPMILFECAHPAVTLYFLITIATLLVYFYITTAVLRATKINLKKIPAEARFCMIMAIRQILLYDSRNIIKFSPHSKFRDLVYQLHLINIAIYYLGVLMYQVELIKLFEKVGMMFNGKLNYFFYVFFGIQLVILGFFVLIYLTPIDPRKPAIQKFIKYLFDLNTYEYYIISCLSCIVLSMIFVFSTAVRSWLPKKFRHMMKRIIFAYCFVIILNCYDTFFYNIILLDIKLYDLSYKNIYLYLNLIVKWVGEISVSFIQVLVVFCLTIPKYDQGKDGHDSMDVFNEIDLIA